MYTRAGSSYSVRVRIYPYDDKNRHLDIPDDLFVQILFWVMGGPDLDQVTADMWSLRAVNTTMKRIVTFVVQKWHGHRRIRNLGMFMMATGGDYDALGRVKGSQLLRECQLYLLLASGKQVQAYLARPNMQSRIGRYLTGDAVIKFFGPPPKDRKLGDRWILGHIHRCNTMRLMLDPTNWKHFWNEDENRPTTLGRQLLQLERAGYRPITQEDDEARGGNWSGFGILLVPRSTPTDPRYLAPYLAYDEADLMQARVLLEFFIRKMLEDGTLGPAFMLPGADLDSPSAKTLTKFLSIEAPHSKLVPTYWPRTGWTHGLDRPPTTGGVTLFSIMENPFKPDEQTDIVYADRWGMESLPESSTLTSKDGTKDVEDLVWTCELAPDSSPCQMIVAYLDSAVRNCPYETVKIEGARLAHDGNMNAGAVWDWAFGDVPIYQFKENRYEITQIRTIYSPKRWDAYLKYKTEHEPADLSVIHWAGEQQETHGLKFPMSFADGECFLVHGTRFTTMKYIARGGFGPSYCKHRTIGGYGSIGQGTYLTDNLAKISTYANCPDCDVSGAPCNCLGPDGKPVERVAIISRVFIPKDVKFTREKKPQYKDVPLTKKPERAMVIGTAGPKSKWPNNVFLLRHPDMAYPEILVYFRWYKGDIV